MNSSTPWLSHAWRLAAVHALTGATFAQTLPSPGPPPSTPKSYSPVELSPLVITETSETVWIATVEPRVIVATFGVDF